MDATLFIEEIREVYWNETRRRVVADWVDRLIGELDVRDEVAAQVREELEELAQSVAETRRPDQWVSIVASRLEELEVVVRSEAALPRAIGVVRVTSGDETWIIFRDKSVMMPDGSARSHYAIGNLDELEGATVEAIGNVHPLAKWIAQRLGVPLTPGSAVI